MKKRLLSFVLTLATAMSFSLSWGVMKTQAAELPNVIKSASVTDASGNTPVTVGPWQPFKIHFNYKLPNNAVHAGDTTTIDLPDGIVGAAPINFEIKDGSNVIATGKLDPSTKKYVLTYTSYVEGKSDISGKFTVNAQVDSTVHKTSKTIPIDTKVSGVPVSAGNINYVVHTVAGLPIIKSGWAKGYDTTKGVWQIKVNQDGKGYTNVSLDDKILTPGIKYIPGSLEVFSGTWQSDGVNITLTNQTNVTSQYASKLVETADGFKLDLGNIPADKGFLVRYQTQIPWTPLPGEKFENQATLNSTELQRTSKASYTIPSAGGTGEGYAYTIKIKKVDEAGQPLAGAVFDVIRNRSGLSVGQVTTDANGEAELKQMLSDDYTIKETKAPNGYDTADDQGITSTEFSPANQTVTKTFVDKKTPTTIDVTVKKVWDDADNQDGLRPTSITVRLLADGVDTGKTLTLDKNGSWQGSFTGLKEKNASGQTITYTVKEDPTIASYIPTITGNATSGYTITNSHTPEVTSISVTKKWVGPTGSAVTVKILANGSDSGKTLTLDAAGNWTGTFSNLPKYKDGVPITYTVTEASVTGVDMSKYTVAITGDVTSGFTITNTNTEKVSVSGTKTWNDNHNQDGKRPASITVNLLKNGTKVDSKTVTPDASGAWTYSFSGLDKYNADGTEITYSVSEDSVDGYTSTVTGTNITNSYTPETTVVKVTKAWVGPKTNSVTVHLLADGTDTGKTLTLDEAGNWTGTFSNLPKYKDGTAITYTVKEDDVANYTNAITGDVTSGFTITNTNTEKVNISGTKTWDDNNNQDGKRPASITVNLLKNGTKVDSKTVTPDASGDWKYSFDGLDKYNADGTEITYTVSEDAVDSYTVTVTGTDIKNSYTPEITSVTVTKAWVGPKTNSVTIHLLADGTDTGKTVTLDEAGNWTGTFSNLPKYKSGTAIVYTVKEDDVANYTNAITGDATTGFTITNTNTEKVNVPVKKEWVGPKAGPVTIHLLADGVDTGKTVTLNEAGNWKGSFDGLRKYKADGTEIVYTVKEDDVANYTSVTTGDIASGFTITNTNTEKVDVPVKKEWIGPKTNSVTVHLLADGVDTGKTLTLDEAGSWTDTFSGLDKYNADGTEIVYSVKEDEVSGYTSEITGDATTGFTITNTEVPHDTPKPKEDTPKKSGKKSGGVVPYTGDSNATGIAIALASAAVVLIGGGVYLRHRGQRE